METNIKTIILDDGIKYMIVEEMVINKTLYTLFANIDNENDICFRKTVKKDGKEYYVGLDDEKELERVIVHFTKNILK